MTKRSGFHMAMGVTAITLVAAFWFATVLVELFGSLETVALVKRGILLAIPALVLALIATNISGLRASTALPGDAIVAKKRRRAVAAALNGLLVLVPAAVLLDGMAARGAFEGAFVAVQTVELIAGAVNFILLAGNVRDGRRLTAVHAA